MPNLTHEITWCVRRCTAELLRKYDEQAGHVDLLVSSDIARCEPNHSGDTEDSCFGHQRPGNLVDLLGSPWNTSSSTLNTTRQGIVGAPLYQAQGFLSRYSARLIDASVSVYRAGGWAYLEVFWPTVCMNRVDGCVVGHLDASDIRLADTPLQLWSCCPKQSSADDMRSVCAVRDQLVLPLAAGKWPEAATLAQGLIHPVKWEEWSLPDSVPSCAAASNSMAVRRSHAAAANNASQAIGEEAFHFFSSLTDARSARIEDSNLALAGAGGADLFPVINVALLVLLTVLVAWRCVSHYLAKKRAAASREAEPLNNADEGTSKMMYSSTTTVGGGK